MQKLQLLCHSLLVEEINPGRIAARAGKACNQSNIDGVLDNAEHDRDVRCRGFCREGRRGAAGRYDDGHASADEVGYQRWQGVVLAVEPVILDCYALAVADADLAE